MARIVLTFQADAMPPRAVRVVSLPTAAVDLPKMLTPDSRQCPVCWIETIKVRLSRTGIVGWQARIDKLLAQVRPSTGELRINVHRPISVPNDVLIVLHWSTPPSAAGSALAFRLCRAFKSFALVDHAVWEADSFGQAGRVN